MKIKCPACKREGDWFAGSYGPFCSRRCKLVDLGKWFSEEHLISSPLPPEDRAIPSDHQSHSDEPEDAQGPAD